MKRGGKNGFRGSYERARKWMKLGERDATVAEIGTQVPPG